MPLNDLIASYQQTITALQKRREELRRRTRLVRGKAYLDLLRRIDTLAAEERDTLEALRLLSRCKRWN
ncbi:MULTISPECIES: hypothetical protein [Anaerotruncus]|uniref:hypothetical protein n=1 Tax=Anaerotruncus TaxID=244127 RepID=UPI00082E3A03|nr:MULTISPECIES: hypothetical protein [Anaerotruncus]RGX55370.1 hypothetical protein DWV16_09105 [Anaerotruncus sp. AF02-27]